MGGAGLVVRVCGRVQDRRLRSVIPCMGGLIGEVQLGERPPVRAAKKQDDSMIDRFDRWFRAIVKARVKKLDPPGYEEYASNRPKSDELDKLHGILNAITAHIGTLLTHISAMIAVLGIMLIIFEDSFYTSLFVYIEMMLYTVLAFLCIYTTRWRGFVTSSESGVRPSIVYQSYLRQRYLYQLCSDGVLIVTVMFLFTLLGHFFFLFF
jgi:hypothetical protein